MTPEQLRIRELEKRLQRIEMEGDILKKSYRALDVKLPEQFSLFEKFRTRFLLLLFVMCSGSIAVAIGTG